MGKPKRPRPQRRLTTLFWRSLATIGDFLYQNRAEPSLWLLALILLELGALLALWRIAQGL